MILRLFFFFFFFFFFGVVNFQFRETSRRAKEQNEKKKHSSRNKDCAHGSWAGKAAQPGCKVQARGRHQQAHTQPSRRISLDMKPITTTTTTRLGNRPGASASEEQGLSGGAGAAHGAQQGQQRAVARGAHAPHAPTLTCRTTTPTTNLARDFFPPIFLKKFASCARFLDQHSSAFGGLPSVFIAANLLLLGRIVQV